MFKKFLKKTGKNFNEVSDLEHATVLQMNSFIYCKTVKRLKNTCAGAKLLVKLMAYKSGIL